MRFGLTDQAVADTRLGVRLAAVKCLKGAREERQLEPVRDGAAGRLDARVVSAAKETQTKRLWVAETQRRDTEYAAAGEKKKRRRKS